MKIITLYVKTLTNKRVTGILLAVDGKVLNKPVKYSLDITSEAHSAILANIEHSVIDAELNDYDAIISVKSNVAVISKKIDSNMLIRKIIDDNNKIMSKKDFYDEYVKITGCVKRTAENHLAEALERGFVQEKDYYTLMVIDESGRQDRRTINEGNEHSKGEERPLLRSG